MRGYFGRDPLGNLPRLLIALLHAVFERDVGTREFGGLAGVVDADDAGVGDVLVAQQVAFELGRRDLETLCV